MPSQLTFEATEFLRNKLLNRNLPPYNKEGQFSSPPPPNAYEYQQNDFNVIDSPDNLIDDGIIIANQYATNKYGPDGGYTTDIASIGTVSIGSNEGPYDSNDADLLEFSKSFLTNLGLNNIYSPVAGVVGENYNFVYTTDVKFPEKSQKWLYSPYLPYWDPPSFRPSFYSPFELFINPFPLGSNGPLSDDSVLAQNSANSFRTMMQYRVQQNLYTETIGRLNFIDALSDPTDWIAILNGNVPLIERNYQITVPQSLLGRGVDFLARLQGVYYPASTIPGDYFDEGNRTENNNTTFIGRTIDYIGGLFGLGGRRGRTPSQLFLDNTSAGQKKQLSNNLEFNKYRPFYVTNSAQNPVGFVSRLLGVQFPAGNYYVGSQDRDPSYISSPPGQIPLDSNGKQVEALVYGPELLAKDFEGTDNDLKLGVAGKPVIDSGGINAGMTWNSQKFGGNAGFKVGPGGDIVKNDDEFNAISSQYDSAKSTNYDFKEGSILYNTQKLIDSQPPNANRYSHAGNAIDQVSKVFNDGYKEITKGSKVISYTNENGIEKGQEYCRIFTKDTPYLTYADLQKTDGNIRKFDYSVLNNTYNLNIAPLKGNGSSNIKSDSSANSNDGHVKKYMFSIENLAWRTSSKPGFRVQDLPICERGQNGGRIMWFPPYELTFSEDSRPDFATHVFLGRPEPVYTYKSTSRSGTLSWKIIVDHPSVLNVIINKVLSKETSKERVNSIIDSFFSGCKKYDLYDLAAKFPSIPISELQLLQTVINNPNSSEENVREAYRENTVADAGIQDPSSTATNFDTFTNEVFYFSTITSSIPLVGDDSRTYQVFYDEYIQKKQEYANLNQNTTQFIDKDVVPKLEILNEIIRKIYDSINNKGVKTVKINLQETTPAGPTPTTGGANEITNSLKAGTVKNYLIETSISSGNEQITLKNFVNEGKVIISTLPEPAETVSTTSNNSITCNQISSDDASLVANIPRMACNSVRIASIITEITPESNTVSENQTPVTQPVAAQQTTLSEQSITGISKRLLRNLLSECDYFEVIKEDDPMLYDSISQKIKYFQPAFHSITPEGLNSRLTFLQQCMRPGETIPTIGADGQPKTTDALNTSFGAPPVLVLRVGDFFNTKIIPTSLSLKYENLDINPEGIGVQPMIATVTMGFNFIGGHGLKEPVQRLQNALSFNYYANTEMYDERATPTENTDKLDKQVLDAILAQVSPPKEIIDNITNNGGNTIGEIINSVQTSTTETGTTSYVTVMNTLISESETYFNSTVNGFEGVVNNYNYGILNLISDNRKYTTGNFGTTTVEIVGKSNKIQDNVDKLFKSVISDINNETNPFFNNISGSTTNADKRTFKRNYKNYLEELQNSFTTNLNTTINDLTSAQENLIFTVEKINYLIDEKADGLIQANGDVKIYKLASNNPGYTEITNDYATIATSVNAFQQSLITSNLLFNNYQPNTFSAVTFNNESDIFKAEYMIICQKLLNNTDEFLTKLKSGVSDDMKSSIDDYYSGLKNQYNSEFDTEIKLITDFKNNNSQFTKFVPLSNTPTERIVEFEVDKASSSQRNKLTKLYDDGNSGPSNTYNGKHKFL
jgi:hypothetical protein